MVSLGTAESTERQEHRSTDLGAGARAARQLTQRQLVVWKVPRNIQPLTSTRLTRNLTKPKPMFLKKNSFQISCDWPWFGFTSSGAVQAVPQHPRPHCLAAVGGLGAFPGAFCTLLTSWAEIRGAFLIFWIPSFQSRCIS